MDIDDITTFWHKRYIIINTFGTEFNQYLHNINAPMMTMHEYECAFWKWYDTRKRFVVEENEINQSGGDAS